MSTDTPAAAPITAEQQAREAFERHIGNQNPKRLLFKRGGSVFAEDVPEGDYVDGGIQRRWVEWQAAWNASAAVSAPVTAMNQCDGCKQGAELRNGLHYDRHGKVFMACQREKYEPPVAPQPAVSGVDALWVETAMKLAERMRYMSSWGEPGYDRGAAREALRTHLSTALTGAAPAVPSGYLHEVDETAHGRGCLRMYSSTAENPWAHWQDAYKAKCVFKTTPLFAAPAAQPADSAMEVLRDARLYLENCTEHRIGVPGYEMMVARIYRFLEGNDRARALVAKETPHG